MTFVESNDDTKMSLDPKPSKATVKNTSKPVSKAESKSTEVCISDSNDLPENISINKQVKKDEKPHITQPFVLSKPALEENIFLGVSLKGSKRTLPIEEEISPSPNPAESKEMETGCSGNASTIAEKDKQDGQHSNHHNSGAPDQSGKMPSTEN
ncbi:hypothetical protein P3L10_013908 [Capsicum annuum]